VLLNPYDDTVGRGFVFKPEIFLAGLKKENKCKMKSVSFKSDKRVENVRFGTLK